ncbi:hypothetical protein NPIL_208291 [Nephila pilipes]|uniref:Uncharacterized protein n=1 Tax=Nephila pilipes TaxID=299642 RepID=A0A8X6NL39_NEPPI|nr:hypothetical protein NPIL_208291 [Nephila pilipes]
MIKPNPITIGVTPVAGPPPNASRSHTTEDISIRKKKNLSPGSAGSVQRYNTCHGVGGERVIPNLFAQSPYFQSKRARMRWYKDRLHWGIEDSNTVLISLNRCFAFPTIPSGYPSLASQLRCSY